MHLYECWVVVNNRDLHVKIQARDGLQARDIATAQYGRCLGVHGPL